MDIQCQATTLKGTQCKNKARSCGFFCGIHSKSCNKPSSPKIQRDKYSGTSFLPLIPKDIRTEQFLYLPISQIFDICDNPEKYPDLSIPCNNLELWKKLWRRDFSEILPEDFEGYKTYKEKYQRLNELDNFNNKLLNAASNGWEKKVQYYIDQGANIRFHADGALRFSLNNGYPHITYLLIDNIIKQKGDINDFYRSIFTQASYFGYLDLVKMALEKIPMNSEDIYEGLRGATMDGQLNVIKYLISKGIDINKNDNRLLIIAAYNGHLDVVKYLVEKGSNIHGHDDMALKVAETKGYSDIIRYLKSLP